MTPDTYADFYSAHPRPPLPRTRVTLHQPGSAVVHTTLEDHIARERMSPREELRVRLHLSAYGSCEAAGWTVRIGRAR